MGVGVSVGMRDKHYIQTKTGRENRKAIKRPDKRKSRSDKAHIPTTDKTQTRDTAHRKRRQGREEDECDTKCETGKLG